MAATLRSAPAAAGGVLDRLAHHARVVLGMERACILVRPAGDPDATLGAVAFAGPDAHVVGRRFPLERGLAVHAIQMLRPVVAPDAEQLMGAAPVVGGRGVRGALWVSASRRGASAEDSDFGPQRIELLSEIALLAGQAIDHHEHGERPEGGPETIRHETGELAATGPERAIRALVRSLARADGSTWRHSVEVAALAREVGRRLGLDEAELVEARLGALLHDVGKLRVPPSILRKAGPLGAGELALVRRHPEWGAEMVAGIPGLEAVSLVVRLHHERPDGSGYPHELPGERIPVASRIVSVCDAYGAMTAGRPYREPLDPDAALEELRRNEGTQFDPLVTHALAAVATRARSAVAV